MRVSLPDSALRRNHFSVGRIVQPFQINALCVTIALSITALTSHREQFMKLRGMNELANIYRVQLPA